MKCPNCSETLLMSERHQVEIDYCPSCRGVWLDKGELDKLLDFAAKQNTGPDTYEQQNYNEPPRQEQRYGDYGDRNKYGQQHPRKKKSFLSDMFDFD